MNFLKKLFGRVDDAPLAELDVNTARVMVFEVLEEWSEKIEIEKSLISNDGFTEWTARGNRDNNRPAILIRLDRDYKHFYVDVSPGIPLRTMKVKTERGWCWEKTKGGDDRCRATAEDLRRTLSTLCRRSDELGCA